MKYWFEPFIWGRVALAAVGGLTVLNAGLVSKIRADRKGGVGNAVATTVGVLYIILAAGHAQIALALAFGHATYRMVQILRAHNIILEHHVVQEALGHGNVGPKEIPEGLFRLCWRINRLQTDFQLPHILHKLRLNIAVSWELSKPMQYVMVTVLLALAGAPLTPVTWWSEEKLEKGLENATIYELIGCVAVLGVLMFISTCLVWLVNTSVLDPKRFHHKRPVTKQAKAMKGLKQPLLGIKNHNDKHDEDRDELLGR
jgi:NADH:ubiquinone oxidoreductase subunit 5 (subunit L)/multisubunit Na+/H+ antiporter MnhA subunit